MEMKKSLKWIYSKLHDIASYKVYPQICDPEGQVIFSLQGGQGRTKHVTLKVKVSKKSHDEIISGRMRADNSHVKHVKWPSVCHAIM